MNVKNRSNTFRLFNQILHARFLSRPNRFLIRCHLDGRIVSAFLPNPGRLLELLIPGRLIYLVREESPHHRKTLFTAVAIDREGVPIMLHTHRTNEVAQYLLQMGRVPGLEGTQIVKSEIRMGRNRFDFLLRKGEKDILLEVKSCTLVGKRVAMFPDAVTERGTRHLKELARFSEAGIGAIVLFIVHWPFAEVFMPDYHTDPIFSQTFLEVRHRVNILPVSVSWSSDLSLSPNVKLLQIPWDYIEEEAGDRGSYLLVLELKRNRNIHVGKLGRVLFRKGFYIYVGSAMAHLSKRMERHRHLRKQHHWHIDELRTVADFHSSLAIRSSTRLECEIAEALLKVSEWVIPGFGCTDCSSSSHLFGFQRNPLHSEKFHQRLQYFRMDRYLSHASLPMNACRKQGVRSDSDTL
jgi:sugar fermentation stimulation protein A